MDSIKIGIVVLNADYSIDKMNEDFMNLFGYKQDDINVRTIDALFNSDDYKSLQRYMKNAEYPNKGVSEKFELN